MEKLAVITEEGINRLCVLQCNHFFPSKGMFLAPSLNKSKTLTRDLLIDIKVSFIENEDTFSIFDQNFGQYKDVMLNRYEKQSDGSIRLVNNHYECLLLTNDAYKRANEIVSFVLTIAESYSEMEDVMCSIRCGGNIVCIPSNSSKKFERVHEYFGVKFLWKGNGISIFGIPFSSFQSLVELIVPDSIASRVIGKKGDNLKRMANEMNVSRIDVICSSWLGE